MSRVFISNGERVCEVVGVNPERQRMTILEWLNEDHGLMQAVPLSDMSDFKIMEVPSGS